MFRLGFQLRSASPGLNVGLFVCLCARSACTPPLPAGRCGVGVCPWARVSAAPRLSWLRCRGVCVFVCVPSLYPATPGWGVRCGCVFLGSGFGCAPPLRAGVLGCVSLCARSACTPPLLASVCGVGVCVWARVWTAPHHSWLGCWGVCVLCARSACTPPLLAAVSAVWVGCCLAPVPVAWFLRIVRAARVCGTRWPLLLGTCPCALVVAGGVPLRQASGPVLVRRASSGPVALGALFGFPDAVVPFPIPEACAPGFTGRLRWARGGRPRTRLFVVAAGPHQHLARVLGDRDSRAHIQELQEKLQVPLYHTALRPANVVAHLQKRLIQLLREQLPFLTRAARWLARKHIHNPEEHIGCLCDHTTPEDWEHFRKCPLRTGRDTLVGWSPAETLRQHEGWQTHSHAHQATELLFRDPLVKEATMRGAVTQALHRHLAKHTENPMEAAAQPQLEAVRRAAAKTVHRKHLLSTHTEQLTDPTAREHMQRLIHYHAVHDPEVH